MYARYIEQQFDVQMSVNDCALNEFIYTLFYADLLYIEITNDHITTTTLSALIGNSLKKTFGS